MLSRIMCSYSNTYMYYEIQNEVFDEQYHCFSTAFAEKPELEDGDKILLPSSAFEQLASMNIEYPMLFELRTTNGKTHCSVLEFTATEGTCYIPFWMMQNLMLEEGDLLSIKNVSLPKATFVKLKPLSTDFFDISNTRAVLEKQLRKFSCVAVGDQICLPYNNKKYYIRIQDVKPSNAACIIECNCNVDFDVPQDYVNPTQENNVPVVQKALSKNKQDTNHKYSKHTKWENLIQHHFQDVGIHLNKRFQRIFPCIWIFT